METNLEIFSHICAHGGQLTPELIKKLKKMD